MRKLFTFLLCVAAASACAQSQPPPSAFVLRDVGRAAVPLDAGWHFQTGDNPAWAASGFDDSAWQPIQVDRPWEGQGHPGYTGFGWYRLHLTLSENSPANWMLALQLKGVEDAAEVYWNGQLVGTYGKPPPHPAWYYRSTPFVFPLGAPHSGVLAIRVWKSPHTFISGPDEGGLTSPPVAGSLEAVEGLADQFALSRLRSHLFTIIEQSISVLVGILALLAWLRDRRRSMLGWLALSMSFSIFELLTADFPQNVSMAAFYSTVGPMVVINDVAIWYLLVYLLGLTDNARLLRWIKSLAILGFLLSMIDTVMPWMDWTRLFPRAFLIIDVASTAPVELFELFVVVIFVIAMRKRQDAARWTLAISALLTNLLQAATDISGLGTRWTHWTLAPRLLTPLIHLGPVSFSVSSIIGTLFLISVFYVAWRSSAEQSLRQGALEQEFRSAQELQQVIIPELLPELPGYAITSAYRPAQEVGGDFFQVIALPDADRAMIIIGDVSGKGLSAAMAVALIVGAIRSTVEVNDDPAAVLKALNRRLHGRLRGGFATCLAMRLGADGDCLIANAGHLPPFLNGLQVDLPPALPLGLVEHLEFETLEVRIAGTDRLTLYTDGLLEARDRAGALFGFDRIAAFLAHPRDAAEVADAAQSFGQEDDITVLTLTMAGVLLT